jgi:hypothetical protein
VRGRIILDLEEIGWECVDSIYLAQDSCDESNEPFRYHRKKLGNILTS